MPLTAGKVSALRRIGEVGGLYKQLATELDVLVTSVVGEEVTKCQRALLGWVRSQLRLYTEAVVSVESSANFAESAWTLQR